MNPLFHELEKYNGWRKYWNECSFQVWANSQEGYIKGQIYYSKVGLFGKAVKTYKEIEVREIVYNDKGVDEHIIIARSRLNKFKEQINKHLAIPQFLAEIQAAIESPLESVKDAALVKVHKYLSEKG